MRITFKKNPDVAFLVLRLGLAFVFIWFSVNQFLNPGDWTSYLPSWVGSLGVSAESFVLMNALVELVAGILLALGAWTRLAALVLGVHLIGIALSVGYNAVAVRDIGLAIATFALVWGGAGLWSIDQAVEAKIAG
jgi:uncharacterized membrane protein YphA (DoxX/SURF4 family)